MMNVRYVFKLRFLFFQAIEGCLKKPHIMIAESLMGYMEQLRQNKQNAPQGRRKRQ